MDIQKSLITYIDNLLRTDTALKAAMGGTVRLYPVQAPPDSVFPYLVHGIDIRPLADYSPQSKSTYIIDIWSYSPSGEEALGIRERVMALLDGLNSSTAETSDFNLWSQGNRFDVDPNPEIWHYTCQFNLKHLNDAQVGILLRR